MARGWFLSHDGRWRSREIAPEHSPGSENRDALDLPDFVARVRAVVRKWEAMREHPVDCACGVDSLLRDLGALLLTCPPDRPAPAPSVERSAPSAPQSDARAVPGVQRFEPGARVLWLRFHGDMPATVVMGGPASYLIAPEYGAEQQVDAAALKPLSARPAAPPISTAHSSSAPSTFSPDLPPTPRKRSIRGKTQ